MTQNDVIKRLQTDAPFALSFAVANNPQGVIDALAANGIVPNSSVTDTPAWAYNTLYKMLSYDKARAINIVTSVPYSINSKATWTNGYSDYFTQYQKAVNATPAVGAKFSLDALLAGLGTGLSTYGTLATQADGTETAPTAAQVAAQKAAADEAAKKKRNMYIGIGIGAVVLIVVLYIVFKKKKTDA